jgi:hypothetical protein
MAPERKANMREKRFPDRRAEPGSRRRDRAAGGDRQTSDGISPGAATSQASDGRVSQEPSARSVHMIGLHGWRGRAARPDAALDRDEEMRTCAAG